MKLDDPKGFLVGQSTIAPAWYAELAVPVVAERLDAPTFLVKVWQFSNQRHEIDDRLGGQPRHRRRADMMDDSKTGAKHPQAFGMTRCHWRPIGIIRGQDDWNRLRHRFVLSMGQQKIKLRHRLATPYPGKSLIHYGGKY